MAIPIDVVTIPSKPGLVPMDSGGAKMVLHTTEVGTEWDGDQPGLIQRCRNRDRTAFAAIYNGVLANWKRGSGFPTQLLVDAPNRRASQCVPMDLGGYALEDTPGGIRPNRAGLPVIQVEIVGHAAQLQDEFTDDDWRWLGTLLRQVCEAEGVPFVFPFPFVSSPAPAYGPTQWGGGAARLSGQVFTATSGVVGHQHVPENLHSDPGLIRTDLMLQGLGPTPLPPPIPAPDPSNPIPGGTVQFCRITIPGHLVVFRGYVDANASGDVIIDAMSWVNTEAEDAVLRRQGRPTYDRLTVDDCAGVNLLGPVPQGDATVDLSTGARTPFTWTRSMFKS